MAAAAIESESPKVAKIYLSFSPGSPNLSDDPGAIRALAMSRLVAAQMLAEREKDCGVALGGMIELLLDVQNLENAARAVEEGREIKVVPTSTTPEEAEDLARLVRAITPRLEECHDIEQEAVMDLLDSLLFNLELLAYAQQQGARGGRSNG